MHFWAEDTPAERRGGIEGGAWICWRSDNLSETLLTEKLCSEGGRRS